jgi:hypothetical protein
LPSNQASGRAVGNCRSFICSENKRKLRHENLLQLLRREKKKTMKLNEKVTELEKERNSAPTIVRKNLSRMLINAFPASYKSCTVAFFAGNFVRVLTEQEFCEDCIARLQGVKCTDPVMQLIYRLGKTYQQLVRQTIVIQISSLTSFNLHRRLWWVTVSFRQICLQAVGNLFIRKRSRYRARRSCLMDL